MESMQGGTGWLAARSITIKANVVCLCPNCAAKLEYASDKERQEMLMLLYMKHNEQLREMGIDISLMELFKYYGMSQEVKGWLDLEKMNLELMKKEC